MSVQDNNLGLDSNLQSTAQVQPPEPHRGHHLSHTFSAGSTLTMPVPYQGPLPQASEMPNQPFMSQETYASPQNLDVPPNSSAMTESKDNQNVLPSHSNLLKSMAPIQAGQTSSQIQGPYLNTKSFENVGIFFDFRNSSIPYSCLRLWKWQSRCNHKSSTLFSHRLDSIRARKIQTTSRKWRKAAGHSRKSLKWR